MTAKTMATVFLRHWINDGGAWRIADNAPIELRTFLRDLPTKYTIDGVHSALDALATGKAFPEVKTTDLRFWVTRPGADQYCQQTFANKKQAPTSFDDLLIKAHKAWQADLVQHVHAFLTQKLAI